MLLVVATTLIHSCGKVTQEVAPGSTKKQESFTMTAKIDVSSTENALKALENLHTFTINDETIYFAISGIVESDVPELLSWGQGLTIENKDSSENITFSSESKNKNNIRITAPNLKESMLTLQVNTAKDPSGNAWTWSARATKLKKTNLKAI